MPVSTTTLRTLLFKGLFEQVSSERADEITRQGIRDIKDALQFAEDFELLKPNEIQFLGCNLREYRIPRLRLLLKIHKPVLNVTLVANTRCDDGSNATPVAKPFVESDSHVALLTWPGELADAGIVAFDGPGAAEANTIIGTVGPRPEGGWWVQFGW